MGNFFNRSQPSENQRQIQLNSFCSLIYQKEEGILSEFVSKDYYLTVGECEIQQMALAYNSSIVLLLKRSFFRKQIRLYSQQGKLIHTGYIDVSYNRELSKFQMLRNDELIFNKSKDDFHIVILSLRNFKKRDIRIANGEYKQTIMKMKTAVAQNKQMKQGNCHQNLNISWAVFPSSDMLCILQQYQIFFKKKDFIDLRNYYTFRLRYYRYGDLGVNKIAPIHQFYASTRDTMWTLLRQGRAIDSHSSFIWRTFNYYIYYLDSSMNGHLNILNSSVKQDIVLYKRNVFEDYLYKISKNKYIVIFQNKLFSYIYNKYQCNFDVITMNNDNTRIVTQQTFYIANIANNCRQQQVTTQIIHTQTVVGVFVKVQKFLQPKILDQYLLLFDKDTGAFIGKQIKAKKQQSQNYAPQLLYSSDWFTKSIIEAVYVPQYPNFNLRIKVIDTSMCFKDAFMSMLLHLNEDFDDDLLQQAIQLLTE